MVPKIEDLYENRLAKWHQTPSTKISGPEEAIPFINQAGMVTLYPASSEIPNLYHAYMGDPDAKTNSSHSSPSGYVYSWRWLIGQKQSAFYSSIVRDRPTWISWDFLPVILKLRGGVPKSEELYEKGELSQGAYTIAQILESSEDTYSTERLRYKGGFLKGKENRNAYLKAIAELEEHMILAKIFSEDAEDTSMYHVSIAQRYPTIVKQSQQIVDHQAMDLLVDKYLSHAAVVLPKTLSKHLKIDAVNLIAVLEERCDSGHLIKSNYEGFKETLYALLPDTREEMAPEIQRSTTLDQ